MRFLGVLACLLLLGLPVQAQQLTISVVPQVSTAGEATHVFKDQGGGVSAPGTVYSAYATNVTSTAGKFMLLNVTTAPTNGATVAPLVCVTLPASGTVSVDYTPSPPARFTTGMVAAVSSNASCQTFTSGTITAFISGIVQ